VTPGPSATKARLSVAATAKAASSVRMHTSESTADTAATPLLNLQEHDDFDVTIIWQNLAAESDFQCFRKESKGPIERILIDFARVLQLGVFENVVSVNASQNLFCVTVVCTKNGDEGETGCIRIFWVTLIVK